MPVFRARHLIPVTSPPIRDGVLVTEGERIVEVRRGSKGEAAIDLGHAAVLPGLVNSHTHLELSGLNGPLEPSKARFTEWLAAVVAWRRSRDQVADEAIRWRSEAIRRGLAESRAVGVTTLADVATWPWSAEPYSGGAVDVLASLEVLGLAAARKEELLARAQAHVREPNSEALERGISPHAPYTVRFDLLVELCQRSAAHRFPLAMHLAETRDELRLLHSADGPLVDWLSALGFWDPAAVPRGIRAMDYLHAMAKAHRAVVVHGNYLDRQELDWLARHRDRMGVVYCPRTHSFFGHAPYPLGEMLAAGVRVSLGTDSRASNPDLSLLAEMRHAARQHPRLAPDAIFRLGTLSGAESLGRQARVGSLAPGKQADFLVIGIGGAADRELLESVLDCGSSVQRVYKSGELVFKAGSC